MYVEGVNEFLGALRGDLFVVVSGEEGTAVFLVMIKKNFFDTNAFVRRVSVCSGEDVQPCLGRYRNQGCRSPKILVYICVPTIAQIPSFSRMWSEPVPNDSSPHIESLPASIKLPKNFHPLHPCVWSAPVVFSDRKDAHQWAPQSTPDLSSWQHNQSPHWWAYSSQAPLHRRS